MEESEANEIFCSKGAKRPIISPKEKAFFAGDDG